MFWLSRPPYLRWTAGWLIVIVSIALQIKPGASVLHPFVAHDVAAGTEIGEGDVVMKLVPAGLLPQIDLPMVVSRSVNIGEPLLASMGAARRSIPDGWRSLLLKVATNLPSGTELTLVVVSDRATREVPGLVREMIPSNGFDPFQALVAIPPDDTAEVAAALTDGRIVVFIDR